MIINIPVEDYNRIVSKATFPAYHHIHKFIAKTSSREPLKAFCRSIIHQADTMTTYGEAVKAMQAIDLGGMKLASTYN